jgi:hypothetical protein
MSYVTLEVTIDHGRIVPKEPGRMPTTGSGLLTILEAAPAAPEMGRIEAFRKLQSELKMTPEKAAAWRAAIADARR